MNDLYAVEMARGAGRDRAGAAGELGQTRRHASSVRRGSARNPVTAAGAPDESLVDRVRAGDHEAFALLMARYRGRVYAVSRGFTRDSEDAHDLVQETFVKAYRGLRGFQGGAGFYTWLCRIAVNNGKDWLRKQAIRPAGASLEETLAEEVGFQPAAEDAFSDPAGMAQREELRAAVRAAVQQLPESLRCAVTLHDIEGLSQQEVAEAMECRLGTAKSRLFRGRERLRRLLSEYVEDGVME